MPSSQTNGRTQADLAKAGLRPGLFEEDTEGGYVISPRDVLQVVRRRIWVILLVTAVFTGVAMGLSFAQTPLYQASIKILVGQEGGVTQNPNDVGGLQQLTKTIAEGVNSRPVAEAAIRQLNLQVTPEEFLESLRVEEIPQTQFVRVSYEDPSSERAQQIANTVGEVFSEQVSEVSPAASSITATVWERAEAPDEPTSPNPGRDGFWAMVLGLMLGTGLAFLLDYLDERWRSPEETEQITGVPTFGVIPEFRVSTGGEKALAGKKRVGTRMARREG